MARRYGKSKRSHASYVRAGKKAARTRKRRYGAKGSRKTRRKGRKSSRRKYGSKHAARVRAGKKAWAARVRRYGSRKAAVAALKRQLGRGGRRRRSRR